MKGRKPKIRIRGTNVASHSYDEQTSTLSVSFSSGAQYDYFNVPKEIADGFTGGSYLRQAIAGKFEHKRIN